MKYIYIFLCIIFITLAAVPAASAVSDCPFGLEEDPAPGACGRYIDTDKNSICDYSQNEADQAAAASKKTVARNSYPASAAGAGANTKGAGSAGSRYAFVPVLSLLTAAYLMSRYFASVKYYSTAVHRRAWNIILLGFFLLSAISGLLLVLKINYRLNIAWPFSLLYWHVETGIAMALVSIFHVIWHIPYYLCIFQLSGKKNNKQCENI